jgi:protein-tyrosine phosphatase
MAIPINENHLNAWKAASDVVVERVKEGKNVLVTCMAGHNRSGIVVGLALAKLTQSPIRANDQKRGVSMSFGCLTVSLQQ